VDRAVLCPAEREQVAAPVALGERGDPVAPFVCALVVENRRARPDEKAARPSTGDRNGRAALQRRRGRLVEISHTLLHLRAGHERSALESKTEHLEVRHAVAPPELGGEGTKLPGRRDVAACMSEEAFVEGKPTVVRPRLELV
jgi:hypothetical protein